MLSYFKLLVVALLVLQVAAIPTSKSFTSQFEVVEVDGTMGKVTWNYDVKQQAESVIYHRVNGEDTVSVRRYTQGVEYLVVEGRCYTLPLTEKSIPSPASRAASFAQDGLKISWSEETTTPAASDFEVPSSCSAEQLKDGIFCSTCQSIGQQVINLGCNATSTEISNLCGSVFASVCKAVLEQACSGVCQIEECATEACCAFDLCDGNICNSTNTTMTHSNPPPQEEKVESEQDGIFCSTCEMIGQKVVGLGCNATSSEISNLCSSLFAGVCKQVLETLCTGTCTIEQCATQACCIADLCSGSSCNATLANASSNNNGLVELKL